MRTGLLTVLAALTCCVSLAGESTVPAERPYKDDPAIVAMLKAMKEGECRFLPVMKTAGKGMNMVSGFKKRGPDVRDYGNKLAYAPDRETAMYCGANHGAPSRLNDASEYHLGSNTWHLICPPAGGDHGAVRRHQNAIKKGKDVEKHKAAIKKWYADHVKVKDGYLQTPANGGPVAPWHTWDGIAYDPQAKCLMWAVLDTDAVKDPKRRVQVSKTRNYAKITGQKPDKLIAQLKPSSSMYMYSPAKKRWTRQKGEGPFPFMRGMGGSLLYVPDMKKTVWYCSAQNVTPNDFAMWAYDAKNNKWANLKPNGGRSVRALVWTDKIAPTGELQMAYSPKHKKIVAVSKAGTWIYDIVANKWAKGCEDKENKAHDATTVFAYDSNADVFLLLNAPDRWGSKRVLREYTIKENKWKTITPKGKMFVRRKYCGNAGYYDPKHNVFVVYGSTEKIWVYRHKKTAAKTATSSHQPGKSDKLQASKPRAKRPFRTPQPAVRSPKQICTGWFSSAKNYQRIGMKSDAKRCLKKIIAAYPKSEWALQARDQLRKL